jgi:hypothetical protein
VRRCGSYTCMHKNIGIAFAPPHKCIPRTKSKLSLIVMKRQKHINYGKKILSYEIYLELVPRGIGRSLPRLLSLSFKFNDIFFIFISILVILFYFNSFVVPQM